MPYYACGANSIESYGCPITSAGYDVQSNKDAKFLAEVYDIFARSRVEDRVPSKYEGKTVISASAAKFALQDTVGFIENNSDRVMAASIGRAVLNKHGWD